MYFERRDEDASQNLARHLLQFLRRLSGCLATRRRQINKLPSPHENKGQRLRAGTPSTGEEDTGRPSRMPHSLTLACLAGPGLKGWGR